MDEIIKIAKIGVKSGVKKIRITGGEPLLQPGFLIACLRACHDAGVHTTLDTSGFGSRGRLLAAAEATDLVLVGAGKSSGLVAEKFRLQKCLRQRSAV